MAGVMPTPRQQFEDNAGAPLSSGTMTTYAAGTSTPLATYSNRALSTANPNPLTLNSAGRPEVSGTEVNVYWLPQVYRVVLKTSTGTTIYDSDFVPATQDAGVVPSTFTIGDLLYADSTTTLARLADVAVGSMLVSGGVGAAPAWATLGVTGVCNFRLSLTTGVPVTEADVTAATTLYCTPNGDGNTIELYNASGVPTRYTSAQFSIAVPATTNTLYSVFAYLSAGVPALELAAWTNDTTPGTAAFSVASNGVWCKTGDLTRRYLGQIRTTAVSGQTEDSYAKRWCVNVCNPVERPMRVVETTDSWTYSTATMRQANGAAGNQLDFLIAVPGIPVVAQVLAMVVNNNADIVMVNAIGLDSTSAAATGSTIASTSSAGNAQVRTNNPTIRTFPGIGRHYLTWLEYSAATATTTWLGDGGTPLIQQSGINGMLMRG